MTFDIKNAKDIVNLEAERDENLLNVLNDELYPTPPNDNLPPQAYCPICQSDMLQVEDIAEGDAGRGVYKYICLNCSSEFYLLENEIASAYRNINNSLREMTNLNRRIRYHSEKIKGVADEF